MIIILMMWLALAGYGISINRQNNPFEREQTLALRGISSVEIMIGHIGLTTGSAILYPNRKAGILFVGIFFLLSGYGVAYRMEHKPDYRKHFLRNRFVKILFPAYFVKIIMIILELLLRGAEEPLVIHWKSFLLNLNWYVWEQLFFYLIFWIVYSTVPQYLEIIVGIISVVFIGIAYIRGMDNPWYGSSLCFVLGIFCYKVVEKRNTDCERHVVEYCVLIGALFLILVMSMTAFFVLGNESILGNPVARNIASLSFVVITVMLLHKFRVVNLASVFLGKCSYEIFLVHPYILSILSKMSIESMALLGILTITLTIVLAYPLHFFVGNLLRCLRRKDV